MGGNILKESFLKNIKDLFQNEWLSDKVLNIVEEEVSNVNTSANTLSTASNENTFVSSIYKTFPIHTMILASQSTYFEVMFTKPENLEYQRNEIAMVVSKNQGRFLEILIKSFYDHDVLYNLHAETLFNIMILANQYGCLTIVEYIKKLMKCYYFKCVEECYDLLNVISSVQRSVFLPNSFIEVLLERIIDDVSNKLCPLECYGFNYEYNNSTDACLKMPYELLLNLLKSTQVLACHENTVLYFIAAWLKFDSSRQSDVIVESLLNEVNYTQLTSEFLSNVITEKHELFSIWSDFNAWFINAISHHSLSAKKLRCNYPFKTFPTSSWNRIKQRTFAYSFYLERSSDLIFSSSENLYSYQGYQIRPSLKIEDIPAEEVYKLYLNIDIKNISLTDISANEDRILFKFDSIVTLYSRGLEMGGIKDLEFHKNFSRKLEFEYDLQTNKEWKHIGRIDKKFFNSWKGVVISMYFMYKTCSGSWLIGRLKRVKRLKKSLFDIKDM